MLQSKNATLSTTSTTLFTVASGHEAMVMGTRIYGGQNGGIVTLTKNNGSSDVFTEKYSVGPGDVLGIDAKSAFPAGYSLKAVSDAAGVQIDVCMDDSEVA